MDGDALETLRERLARYPADRYPVQHATAAFHLGHQQLSRGHLPAAESALRVATSLFDPEQLPAEHAVAANLLGVTLREARRPVEAAEQFRVAAAGFAAHGQPADHGAARFNLGLVQREVGLDAEAAAEFEHALAVFVQTEQWRSAAAASRELGAALLAAGDADRAAEVLVEAVRLAREHGDAAAAGAAYNTLGLAELALDRADEAAVTFAEAAAAHARTVRPEEYAMAKGNLALALERCNEPAAARLAARQAVGVRQAAPAVRAQAAAVLDRLGGTDGDDLVPVLRSASPGRWPAMLREELLRWADDDPPERVRAVRAWIASVLDADVAGEVVATWVGALLELPPEQLRTVVAGTLDAVADLPPAAADRFRSLTSRGMARFPLPQWQRLAGIFERAAAESGRPGGWA